MYSAENRDNFHNLVLSGIHQHLHVVNNNDATQVNAEMSGPESCQDEVPSNDDLLGLHSTQDNLPGLTCRYGSRELARSELLRNTSDKDGETSLGQSGKFDRLLCDGDQQLGTALKSSGSTQKSHDHQMHRGCSHRNRSSHFPFRPVLLMDKALDAATLSNTQTRLSCVSETDAESGVNYHIQSCQPDAGSEAGDVSACSSGSRDSDLCSCGQLGLDHSHTNCSNVSTRGSLDIPSDVSSCDSNVYRSQSPGETRRGQDGGKGPPPQTHHQSMAGKSGKFPDYGLLVLPTSFESAGDAQHSCGPTFISSDPRTLGFLPHVHGRCLCSQPSIISHNTGCIPKENLECDHSELNIERNPISSSQAGNEHNSQAADVSLSLAICDAEKRPNDLTPMDATGQSVACQPLMRRIPHREQQDSTRYSRNSDTSLSSNDTSGLSPFVSDWCPSGSDLNEFDVDSEQEREEACGPAQHVSTRLLNCAVPVIPCSLGPTAQPVPRMYVRRQPESDLPEHTHKQGSTSCKPMPNFPESTLATFLPARGHFPWSQQMPQMPPDHAMGTPNQSIQSVPRRDLDGYTTYLDNSQKNLMVSPRNMSTDVLPFPPTEPVILPNMDVFASLSVSEDEQLATLATGAGDQLADIHDIHTSDELDLSPGGSSSSCGGARRAAPGRPREANSTAKDTVVTVHSEGIRIVCLLGSGLSMERCGRMKPSHGPVTMCSWFGALD